MQLEGEFFDDWDEAFGDANDVPILDLKKKKEEAEK